MSLCVFLQEVVVVGSFNAPVDNVLTSPGGVMELKTVQMIQMSKIVVSKTNY